MNGIVEEESEEDDDDAEWGLKGDFGRNALNFINDDEQY